MITLDKLVVKNFRLINNIVIEPANKAITGIIGQNGSGKSSLLIALKWCLFGETPENVKQGDLRRQGSKSEDPCSVEATITHDGQKVKIKREIRGKNNTATVNIWVDGTMQSKTSVGTADRWVKKRLGFGVEMFNTIFVIGQKELDNLIKDKPAARRALVERLTGIEKLSKALESARGELSSSKKGLSGHEVTEATVDNIESIVADAQETLSMTEKEAGSLKANVVLKEKRRDEAKNQYDSALKKYEDKKNQENTIKLIEEHQVTLVNNTKYLSDTVNEQDIDDKHVDEDDLEGLKKSLEDAVSLLEAARSSLNDLSVSAHNSKETIAVNKKLIEEHSEAIEEASDQDEMREELKTLTSQHNTLAKEIANGEEDIAKKRDMVISLSTNLKSTQDVLTSIETTEHDLAKCPTCESKIANKSEFIKKINKKVDDEKVLLQFVEQDLSDVREKNSEKQNELNSLFSQIENIQTQQEDYINSETALSNAKKELIESEASYSKLESEIKTLQEKILTQDEEVSEYKKLVYDFENILNRQKSLEKLKENLKKANAELDENSKKLVEAKEKLEDIDAPSLEEGHDLRKEYDDADKLFREAAEEENKYKTNMESAKVILAENRVRLENAKTALKKKQEAIQYVSHITAAVDLIASYRKDYLAKLAPELSSEATMLISQMTQGKYIEIILDENFTPSVMDTNGTIRPVAWLSGGEESIVALALRMAIGDIVSQGSGGLLWLDEVLTAQDDGRRSALLTTLREYGHGRQVIIINHSPESIDSVDNIIEIEPTDDGSFLKEKNREDELPEE